MNGKWTVKSLSRNDFDKTLAMSAQNKRLGIVETILFFNTIFFHKFALGNY